MNSLQKSRKLRRWSLILLVPLFLGLGIVIWALIGPGAMPEAQVALVSDSRVEVDGDKWLVLSPKDGDPKTGLIIYTGGRVDAAAYAPLAWSIAAEGQLLSSYQCP